MTRPPRGTTARLHPSGLALCDPVLVAGIVLIPLLATALGGFKSLGELRVNPFGLPAEWEWRNYWEILSGGRYWQLHVELRVIAALTVILTVAASAMAAFVFVHVRFFGSHFC